MPVDDLFVEVSDVVALEILEGSQHAVSMLSFGIERFIRDAIDAGATLDSLNVQVFRSLESGVEYFRINVTGRKPTEDS